MKKEYKGTWGGLWENPKDGQSLYLVVPMPEPTAVQTTFTKGDL